MTDELNNAKLTDEMVELVSYIAKNLVDEPEEVKVSAEEKEGETVIELNVAKDDMGKVIGKQGRIANAIRAIVHAASVKSNGKYLVEIR